MNKVTRAIKIMGIAKPYRIILISRVNTEVDGMYYSIYSEKKKNLSHLIKIWVGNASRTIEAAIIHELIHAWQEEKGLTEYHGPQFRRMARILEKKLNLVDVYRKSTDTENPD